MDGYVLDGYVVMRESDNLCLIVQKELQDGFDWFQLGAATVFSSVDEAVSSVQSLSIHRVLIVNVREVYQVL